MLFRKIYTYADIYYAFLDYGPLNDNDYLVGQSIMQLARLEFLVATTLKSLHQSEKRGGYELIVFPNMFTSHVSETVSFPKGQVGKSVQIWEPEAQELAFKSAERGLEEDRKWKLMSQPRPASQLTSVLSTNWIFKTIENEWFTRYM